MLTYESDKLSRDELDKMRWRMVCAECSAPLALFWDREKKLTFLTCRDYLVTRHEQIGKPNRAEDKSYQEGGRQMVQVEKEHGLDKARQLVKYQGVTSLTRQEAMEILDVIWPDAPGPDKVAAAILCVSYGLNPLANHVFLIPFKDKAGQKTWARVWGIKAKRLLASRKGGYSYLDMTPRLMTEQEQVKVWGVVDTANLCYMTHLKDMKTGAECYGYGKWPKNTQPYGLDKGNTQANMASIRSESQALDRLRPAEMPTGWTATDEEYIEGSYEVVEEKPAEIIEQNRPSIIEEEVVEPVIEEEQPTPAGFIAFDWLQQSIKRLQDAEVKGYPSPSLLGYIKTTYKVEGNDIYEAVAKLDKGQATHFIRKIEEALKKIE